eukprot:1160610-Pelagomonas_calceolata.AAC.14
MPAKKGAVSNTIQATGAFIDQRLAYRGCTHLDLFALPYTLDSTQAYAPKLQARHLLLFFEKKREEKERKDYASHVQLHAIKKGLLASKLDRTSPPRGPQAQPKTS